MDYRECAEVVGELQRARADGRYLPELLTALGEPARGLRGMQVVGTNGKGSTCAFAVAALTGMGLRVGSLPSPHLQEPRERIRVGGVPVSEAEYVAVLEEVLAAMRATGRTFNASSLHAAAAALHFRRADVRFVAAEANIGGRTTAVGSFGLDVKVVTGVGLDHTDRLGATEAEIARVKVGVARDGDHVLLGRLSAQAREAADEVLAGHTGLTVWRLGHEIRVEARTAADGGTLLEVRTPQGVHRDLVCTLPGAHQYDNLALAVAGVDALVARGHVAADRGGRLRAGLARTRWPGRLELVPGARVREWSGRVLLDGATNEQGVATVAPEIARHVRASDRVPAAVVFGVMRGKPAARMLAALPSGWPVVLTRTSSSDAADPDVLAALPRGHGDDRPTCVEPDVRTALGRAGELVGPGGLVVVLGSHKLVGEARTALGLPPA
ncbi:bifunctional folylpolyglutamate synthase/dihydrofolate synthase [Embleya sp. NPDC020886]|uniref:bifunctional folylpolyglutamate synthase/dihydrofolate synthase n=1 Tax=Embleya sp. NPDC020886 TaxID=3363980 RepID=UPI003791AD27